MADKKSRYFTASAVKAVTPEVEAVLNDLRKAQVGMTEASNKYLETPVKNGGKTPREIYGPRKKATAFKFASAKSNEFLQKVEQAENILAGNALAEEYNTIFVTRDAIETVANKYGLAIGYATSYAGELTQEAVDALAEFDENFDRDDYRGEFLNQAEIDAAIAHNEKYPEKKEVPQGQIKYRILAPVSDFSGNKIFTPKTNTDPATTSPIIYTATKNDGLLIVTGWNPVTDEDA